MQLVWKEWLLPQLLDGVEKSMASRHIAQTGLGEGSTDEFFTEQSYSLGAQRVPELISGQSAAQVN